MGDISMNVCRGTIIYPLIHIIIKLTVILS